MKPSTSLPALATTLLPAIGHLAMEREHHTVGLPPASMFFQSGRTDLIDFVTLYLFIYNYYFLFLLFIYIFLFLCSASLLNAGNAELWMVFCYAH